MLHDRWLKVPSREVPNVDKDYVELKASHWKDKIDAIVLHIQKNPGKYEKANALREEIRNMRRSSLRRVGEFSIENLVFKNLRNSGYIERLITASRRAYDASVSV